MTLEASGDGATSPAVPAASSPRLATPDVTPAQVLAVVKWAVAQSVALHWVDAGTSRLVVQIGSTVLAAAWIIADTLLRRRRALAAASLTGGDHTS